MRNPINYHKKIRSIIILILQFFALYKESDTIKIHIMDFEKKFVW